jgi:hypothetical protein
LPRLRGQDSLLRQNPDPLLQINNLRDVDWTAARPSSPSRL